MHTTYRHLRGLASIYRGLITPGIWAALFLGCGSGGGSTSTGNFTIPGGCTSGPTSLSINYFLENPRTSSGNSSLAFSSTLTTSQTTVGTISGLTGNCLLQSDRFLVNTDSIYPSYVVAPTNGNMRYRPVDPEFQQLNSFYYATAVKNLLVGLGADLASFGLVNINAHCNVENNAFYSPSSKRVCLGYALISDKIIWAADDADVVIHEVGHAINHNLASTSIMSSSGEASALDEAVADYWALTLLNDGQLSEWFLGALGSSYVRDATQNQLYPQSMVYQIHEDSRVITQTLWSLRGTLGSATTNALVKRSMQLLPASTRFKDFYQAFYDASGPAFVNLPSGQRAAIVSAFTAKGLHRVDSAAGLQVAAGGAGIKDVYVIDDYSTPAQANGNCNGALDVGETALVLVNLENKSGSRMGMGEVILGAVPAGIQVPSGGNFGEFFRLNATSDFVSSLPPAGANRDEAVYWASFLLRATSTGGKNLSLVFTPMFADPTGAASPNPDVTVSFSLNVGSAGPSANCTDASLWP
jgi:hypothetical protein